MNPAQECAAGTKNTARRRQGYGGLAYLPAEASAKAGALFDIVNMKRAPIGMGAEPTGERVPARSLLAGVGCILAKRSHVAQMQHRRGEHTAAATERRGACYFPCYLQDGLCCRYALHARAVARCGNITPSPAPACRRGRRGCRRPRRRNRRGSSAAPRSRDGA